MMRRLAAIPGITFALVFGWKVALALLTAQPVPANDAFFYDGPVVNYLLHGSYCNPALALVLPISGAQVFTAYPPLYQLTLFAWMKVFGPGVFAALWLHVLLFGGYSWGLFRILQRLRVPSAAINLAGLFLLSITFHDRPDSLAQLFGMLAVYAAVRSHSSECDPREFRSKYGPWLAGALLVLTLGTSLQIGGFYLVLVWFVWIVGAWVTKGNLPVGPMAISAVLPAVLVVLVIFRFPLAWAGFLEHARLTPTITGLRLPHGMDVLKVIRTVPGVLVVAACLPLILRAQKTRLGDDLTAPLTVVIMGCALMGLAVVGGSLFLFTPNLVAIANYIQPLLVGSFLAFIALVQPPTTGVRKGTQFIGLLAVLVSIRAVGMTTWGVLCASDMPAVAALTRVRMELQTVRGSGPVTVSSAFLYEAARFDELRWIHSDWPAKPDPANPNWERDALLALKPAKLVLTQFDYFRRYEAVLTGLAARPDLVTIHVQNTARVSAPDAFPFFQKVVQHVAWAPVVVDLAWR